MYADLETNAPTFAIRGFDTTENGLPKNWGSHPSLPEVHFLEGIWWEEGRERGRDIRISAYSWESDVVGSARWYSRWRNSVLRGCLRTPQNGNQNDRRGEYRCGKPRKVWTPEVLPRTYCAGNIKWNGLSNFYGEAIVKKKRLLCHWMSMRVRRPLYLRFPQD